MLKDRILQRIHYFGVIAEDQIIPAKDRISAERQRVDTIIDILKLESECFSLAQGKQVKNTENDTEETKNNDKR